MCISRPNSCNKSRSEGNQPENKTGRHSFLTFLVAKWHLNIDYKFAFCQCSSVSSSSNEARCNRSEFTTELHNSRDGVLRQQKQCETLDTRGETIVCWSFLVIRVLHWPLCPNSLFVRITHNHWLWQHYCYVWLFVFCHFHWKAYFGVVDGEAVACMGDAINASNGTCS